ncbi:hypothetical protein OB13_13265, partial [Pontibacter sp. HJ8]
MLFLILIRCFLLFAILKPQNETTVKNLQAELEQTHDTIRKIEIYCQLSQEQLDSSPKAAVTYGIKAIALAKGTPHEKLLARAYNSTGSGYYLLGDLENAVDFYYRALRLREKIGDPKDIGASYNNIANIYIDQGNYKEALPIYKKSLSLATLAQDSVAMSGALTNIGNV